MPPGHAVPRRGAGPSRRTPGTRGDLRGRRRPSARPRGRQTRPRIRSPSGDAHGGDLAERLESPTPCSARATSTRAPSGSSSPSRPAPSRWSPRPARPSPASPCATSSPRRARANARDRAPQHLADAAIAGIPKTSAVDAAARGTRGRDPPGPGTPGGVRDPGGRRRLQRRVDERRGHQRRRGARTPRVLRRRHGSRLLAPGQPAGRLLLPLLRRPAAPVRRGDLRPSTLTPTRVRGPGSHRGQCRPGAHPGRSLRAIPCPQRKDPR